MKEIFKDISGWKGLYKISNLGNVFSVRNNKELKNSFNKRNGYYYIRLYNHCKNKALYIHRLVAIEFILNPKNLKEVNHKDCNKSNNNVSNLEWVSRKQNIQHAHLNNLYKKRRGECMSNKLTDKQVLEIRRDYIPNTDSQWYPNGNLKYLMKKYKVSKATISGIVSRRYWKHL
ncbi:MAG: NUMOD4 domain-containing protein [Melioribacteraceae bacterium]